MTEADHAAKARCTRFLSHHLPVDPRTTLQRLAAHPAAEAHADVYGEGGAVELLERRTIDLLGHENGGPSTFGSVI